LQPVNSLGLQGCRITRLEVKESNAQAVRSAIMLLTLDRE